MNEDNALGNHLRLAREQKQLSLRAVEKVTGVSNAYISQLESGKIKQPSPKILHKLCELYEISYDDVLGLADYPVSSNRTTTSAPTSLLSRIGPLTHEEESALEEYLLFLRSRRSRKE